MGNYSFIDVLADEGRVGFQVKSAKQETTITWMRANLENRNALIASAEEDDVGVKALGDAIIDFANAKIAQAFADNPNLEVIIYARFKLLKTVQSNM